MEAPVHCDLENKTQSPEPTPNSEGDQNSIHSSDMPQNFHLFMMLPAEIRIDIWKMAAGPRYKEIFEVKPLDSKDPLPQGGELAVFKVRMDMTRIKVAQACFESWEIIRGTLEISDWPHTPMRTYMDRNLDYLMLPGDLDLDMVWMKPECLIGNAQHLILDASESLTLNILDDIPASPKIKGGFLSSVKTISIAVMTFRIPARASNLHCDRFSTKAPFVIDLDNNDQLAWMAFILYLAIGTERISVAFIHECIFRRHYPRHVRSRVRERIHDNMSMDNIQDQKIPDIKSVILLLDESDKRPNVPLLDADWATSHYYLV